MEKKRGFEIAKGWEDKGINMPIRKTAHSAGYDVEAAEDTVIPKFHEGIKPTLVPTGFLNRSSGPKKGLILANSVGLVDSDYYGNESNDGHFMFAFFNCSDHDVVIKKGDAIGQVVFTKYLIVDNDNATGVRTGGFGSTGK